MFKPLNLKNPNVKILTGEPELVGRTGVIFGREGKLDHVRLDEPVEISGKVVETATFLTAALRIIRPPVVKVAKAPAVEPVVEQPVTLVIEESRTTELSAVFAQLGIPKPSDEPVDGLPGDALTAAEHVQVYPGGEPIVPETNEAPVVEAVVEKPLSARAAKRATKRAAMAQDPALEDAQQAANADVLAQPVEAKGKKGKGKKQPKVDRGAVIRKR